MLVVGDLKSNEATNRLKSKLVDCLIMMKSKTSKNELERSARLYSLENGPLSEYPCSRVRALRSPPYERSARGSRLAVERVAPTAISI